MGRGLQDLKERLQASNEGGPPADAKRLAPHQPDLGVALNCAKEGASAAATT